MSYGMELKLLAELKTIHWFDLFNKSIDQIYEII